MVFPVAMRFRNSDARRHLILARPPGLCGFLSRITPDSKVTVSESRALGCRL